MSSGATVEEEEDGGTDGAAGAGGGTVKPAAGAGLCSIHGWCWELPLPQGEDLKAVWMPMADEMWAVGKLGTVLRLKDGQWTRGQANTTATMNGVWGVHSADVWVVGAASTVLHFDGAQWTSEQATAEVREDLEWADVHGTTSGAVVVVGSQGRIARKVKGQWVDDTGTLDRKLNSVWMVAPDNIYAVGVGSAILRYDGKEWKGVNTSGTIDGDFVGVAATSENDVWVASSNGKVTHYDGQKWESRTPAFASKLVTLSVQGTEAWIGGLDGKLAKWAAGNWTQLSSGTTSTLRGIWGIAGQQVAVVGDAGLAETWTPDGTRVMRSYGVPTTYRAVAGVGDTAWAVGATALHRTASWEFASLPVTQVFNNVWMTSASDGFAVGNGGNILQLRDNTWSLFPAHITTPLYGVWANNEGTAWVVGRGQTILGLMNGVRWQRLSCPVQADLYDVWGLSGRSAWAVGSKATAVHWDGGSWKGDSYEVSLNLPQVALYGVWGSSESDVWAVGSRGTILHYDGSTWSVASTGDTYALYDVTGSAKNDVWAVGSEGAILHWDGSWWARHESGLSHALRGVWMDARQVWVVGEKGSVLRRSRESL